MTSAECSAGLASAWMCRDEMTFRQPWGRWHERGVELGHHLPPHHRARDLAVPLSGDRRLETQGGALGCRRTRRPRHCGGSGE
jgi:hypothetical protein